MPDLSPAQELREAARLMRERASRVPQTWRRVRSQIVAVGTDALPGTDVIGSFEVPHRTAYVASMGPPVAKALARWLEATARQADSDLVIGSGKLPPACRRCSGLVFDDCRCGWEEALAVARAYLTAGES